MKLARPNRAVATARRWLLALTMAGAALAPADSGAQTVQYRLSIPGVMGTPVTAFGFSQRINTPQRQSTIHDDLIVVKTVDKATPLLAQHLCTGMLLPTARMEARVLDAATLRYFSIHLSDVVVASMATQGAAADPAPTEQVSLNYSKIEWTSIQTDSEGVAAHATSTYWDQGTATGGSTDPDSDGDGIPDSYETHHALKPLIDDADGDDDGDGLNNIREFWAGTSASDSNSLLRVTGIATPTTAGFNVEITFDSVTGKTYDLFAVSDIGGTPELVDTLTALADVTTRTLLVPGPRAFILVKVRAE